MSNGNANGTAANAQRLLWAGFMAIAAAGVGFSIRGGILGDWGAQFGFTQSDLGAITGGGLTGFGIIILFGALLADKLGYGRLMITAFLMHLISAVLTLAATPLFNAKVGADPVAAKAIAYQCLFWGMFLFAIGNGIAESVVNPLVATLFPKQKTHYLNILHAGWPGGLIVGGLLSYFMVGKVKWEIQMSLFLLPVVIYGVMLLGQRFPESEASKHGVEYSDMLKELGLLGAIVIAPLFILGLRDLLTVFAVFGAPVATCQTIGVVLGALLVLGFLLKTKAAMGHWLMAFLLVIHAMVGYVELGTDSWISNITGNIMASREKGLLLFVYTSALMFALRFFAGPIVHQISPLGLLLVSAVFGAVGLVMLGGAHTVFACVVAATIYGLGKTYFWPTMLGVVSERFPKGGAITIGAIGGVGMLSAGLLGGPGIGYKQDYFASNDLKEKNASAYESYKSQTRNRFLFFPEIQGLDGAKVAEVRAKAPDVRTPEEKQVHDADLHGGRTALRVTAAVPATMAICYLLIIIYFKARGGYKQVHIEGEGKEAKEVP
jgi:MFS family permease